MKGSRRWMAECAAVTLAALALRIRFLAPYPSGWDDVDFALALRQFDLSRMQPHFPGYPVYILAAHLFDSWTTDPFRALSLLSAWAGGLTVVPLWLIFRRLGSEAVTRLAAGLYAVIPLPFVSSLQPTSDALGAFVAAWLAYFALAAGLGGSGSGERSLSGTTAQVRFGASASALAPAQFCYGATASAPALTLIAAGLALGLLLGVRISYFALSVLWFWALAAVLRDTPYPVKRRRRAVIVSVTAAAVVCAVWLAALVRSEGGAVPFLKLALSFTEGHFSDWGGAYRPGESFAARAWLVGARQIGAAGLGTVWHDAGGFRWIPTAMAAIAAAGLVIAGRAGFRGGFRLRLDHPATFLLLWIAPYLLWALLAQNAEKPRHILPLLPPLLFLLASGLDKAVSRIRGSGILIGLTGAIWLAGTACVTYPLAAEAHTQEPPVVRLARYVKDHLPAENRLIFTWEEQRVISYFYPEYTVKRLRKWEDFRTEVLQYPEAPADIYATNAFVEGMDRPVKQWFEPVAQFGGSPWLYPTYHTIVLYRANPRLYEAIRTGKED